MPLLPLGCRPWSSSLRSGIRWLGVVPRPPPAPCPLPRRLASLRLAARRWRPSGPGIRPRRLMRRRCAPWLTVPGSWLRRRLLALPSPRLLRPLRSVERPPSPRGGQCPRSGQLPPPPRGRQCRSFSAGLLLLASASGRDRAVLLSRRGGVEAIVLARAPLPQVGGLAGRWVWLRRSVAGIAVVLAFRRAFSLGPTAAPPCRPPLGRRWDSVPLQIWAARRLPRGPGEHICWPTLVQYILSRRRW